MFSAWLRGPEDNSLEGRKRRLVENPTEGDTPLRGATPNRDDLAQAASAQKAAQPRQPVGDAAQPQQAGGRLGEFFKGVISRFDPKHQANIIDKARKPQKTSSKSVLLSGLQSSEDFPQLPGRLGRITELARQYVDRENEGYYENKANQQLGDKTVTLPGSEYFDSEAVRKAVDENDITDISQVIPFLTALGDRNTTFSKQGLAYPQEIENLVKNYQSEDDTLPENIVQKAIRNQNVSIEDIQSVWPQVPREMRTHFENTGHGQGGGHPYWEDHKEEWGQHMMLRYLQQLGRDGYLAGEDSLPIHPQDMAADHALAYSEHEEFWNDKAKELHPELSGDELRMAAWRMADDPGNIVHTRWGFNQSQKDASPLWSVVERLKRQQKGQGKKADESVRRKLVAELKAQEYTGPLGEAIDEILADGTITQEEYDTIRDMAHSGYGLLDIAGYGRDLKKKPGVNERNVLTDPFRALTERIKLGPNMGLNILAGDRLRSSDTAAKSGWQGIDGKHTSTSANGNFANEFLHDPALDFIKDRLSQSVLFGGKEGKLAARNIMSRIKRAGDALVTGDIGTQQFVQYIADNLKALDKIRPEGAIKSPHDIDKSAEEYKKILNAVMMKTVLQGKDRGFNEERINDNITMQKRPNMASRIRNENLYEEFETLHGELKGIFGDNWNELYKGSILEEVEDLDYNGENWLAK